jgi:hypothetical protein
MKKQNNYEFKLIDGHFYPDEAMKVLMSLFNNKINFHELESFSSQIRDRSDISSVQNRIQSLKNDMESIKCILQQANANGKQIKIESVIQMTFLE